MQQLSLWAEAERAIIPPGWRIWRPQEILYRSTCWADGDTRPEALEKLAIVLLGDWESIERNDGVRLVYRIISTGVVNDQVVCAMQYLGTMSEVFGGCQTEEEDEYYD